MAMRAGKKGKNAWGSKTPSTKSAARSVRNPVLEDETEVTAANRKALWTTFRALQKRVDQALAKLRTHFKKGSTPNVIMRDKKELLLLLGECNYMARTCEKLKSSQDKLR